MRAGTGRTVPEAPPLSLEGARSWFPAPAWEPETTCLPVCGRWERLLFSLPHGPEPGRGLAGGLPTDQPGFPAPERRPGLPPTLLGLGQSHTLAHTRHSWREGHAGGVLGTQACRQLGEPRKWGRRQWGALCKPPKALPSPMGYAHSNSYGVGGHCVGTLGMSWPALLPWPTLTWWLTSYCQAHRPSFWAPPISGWPGRWGLPHDCPSRPLLCSGTFWRGRKCLVWPLHG